MRSRDAASEVAISPPASTDLHPRTWLPHAAKETLPALPLLLAVGFFIALAAADGGLLARQWYPGALFVLGLLVVTVVALGSPAPVPKAVIVAVVLFAGYAVWSYASIAWADQQGDAFEGANRTLLYAIVFALFALWPIRTPVAVALSTVFGLGVAILGLVELLRANAAADPVLFFIEGRFSAPIEYPSANVALLLSAVWPCAVLATRREAHPALRGACLGAAGALLGLALMGQSRGSVFAIGLAVPVFIALVPGKARVLVTVLALGAAMAAIADPVLDLKPAIDSQRPFDEPLERATRAILLASAVLAVLGVAVAYLERRLTPSPTVARRAGGAIVAAFVLAAAGALIGWTVREGSPVTSVADAWDELKEDEGASGESRRLVGSLGGPRYDVWRVAWALFRDRPVAGVGADNFLYGYLRRGRTSDQPRYPHSLELRVLSQTGLIGMALFGGAIAAALLAAALALRRAPPAAAAMAAGAMTVFLYWVIHGSVDWFWEFPSLGAPAVAMLGVACALLPREAGQGRSDASAPARRGMAILLAALASVAAAVLALSWVAELHVRRATETWVSRPADAFDDLDRAASLNPLSSKPALVAGTIALRLGLPVRAQSEFTSALERDPKSPYATLQLGAIASSRGEQRRAVALLGRAVELSPRDEVATTAFRRARGGRRVDVDDLNRELFARALEEGGHR